MQICRFLHLKIKELRTHEQKRKIRRDLATFSPRKGDRLMEKGCAVMLKREL